MTNVLLRQFINGRKRTYKTEYIKMFGMKTFRVLDSVIPDLTDNLSSAMDAFLDAVVGLDEQFIESTSTRALQRVLLPQMHQLKANQTSIRVIDWLQEAPKT